MFISRNTVIFFVIVTIASVTTTVSAACVDRQAANATSDSTMDKVSNFFVDIGCTLKSGADKVKERVESGYNYIKSKITPDDVKNATMIDNKVPLAKSDDRITFKDDQSSNDPEMNASEITTTSTNDDNNPGTKLENRVALRAPEICPKGQSRIEGRCREVFSL